MARRRQGAPDISRFSGGGVTVPSSDFNAVNNGLKIPYEIIEIDLSIPRSIALNTQDERSLQGNSVYIDQNTDVGVATLILQGNSKMAPPGRIYVQPGANFQIPFTRLILENLAQPGKVMRIFYGVDIDFKPGVSAPLIIAGVVSTAEQGALYGSAFSSTSLITAGTPLNVFLAASNPNGFRIHDARLGGVNGTNTSALALLSKASAPATLIDGDVLMTDDIGWTSGAAFYSRGKLLAVRRVSGGKRLDFMVGITDTGTNIKSALYDLL
jgi:hypothetical protein